MQTRDGRTAARRIDLWVDPVDDWDDHRGLDQADPTHTTYDHASGARPRDTRRIAKAGRVRLEAAAAIRWINWPPSLDQPIAIGWNPQLRSEHVFAVLET